MSSQFLTFIFSILVSVQLSSCVWRFPWENDTKKEMSTEKNFKNDEPNSWPTSTTRLDDSNWPLSKDPNVLSIDNNQDESSRESSAQSIKTTLENVSAMLNEESDVYTDEESSEFANSEKEIKSIPPASTDASDKIVNYVSSTTTQITDSSTPATEKSESESSTTDNTNTSTTTGNTLIDNDDVNNVPRNADEDEEDSKGSSSVSVSSSTIPSSLENSNFEIETVSNSSEFFPPEVTYAPNEKDISSWIDEEKEPTSNDQEIGRKDKETHSSRNVTDYTLNDNDDVNNVPRNADENREDANFTSSVISSSTISNLYDDGFLNDTGVSSSSEYTDPKVTYFNNSKDGSSTSDIDEKTLTPTDRPTIGRIVPHSPREVNQSTDYSTQKITTENYESGDSTTDMTNAPTTTENTPNSTSNNEARNVINKTENSDNEDSKPEIIKDLDQSPSSEANTTIKTILSTSTNTMNTTEMAGSMSNVTTPEVNFGSFVNSGSTGNTNSQLILNLCILIFSISVIV